MHNKKSPRRKAGAGGWKRGDGMSAAAGTDSSKADFHMPLFVFVLFYILIYIVFYVFRMYGYSGGIYRIYPFPSGGSHAQSLGGSA